MLGVRPVSVGVFQYRDMECNDYEVPITITIDNLTVVPPLALLQKDSNGFVLGDELREWCDDVAPGWRQQYDCWTCVAALHTGELRWMSRYLAFLTFAEHKHVLHYTLRWT